MFQLSLKILLAALMFVNLAFSVPIEEFNIHPRESDKVLVADVENSNRTEKQQIDQIDSTDHQHHHQDESFKDTKRNSTIVKKEQQKETSFVEKASTKELSPTLQSASESPIALNRTDQKNVTTTRRPVEETTPINNNGVIIEIPKPNDLTGEQKNLNQCCVTPLDDEDVTTIKTVQQEKINSSVSSNVSETTSSTTKKNVTIAAENVISPKTTPASEDVNDKKKADNETIEQLKPTMYETVSPESINATTETSTITSTSSEITTVSSEINTMLTSENDQVKVGNDTVILKKEKKVEHEGLSLESKESINEDEKDSSGSMPPGIIALVTAITFALAITIGYISTVIWKQYLERKYGRRELLVNELEFDTNDLRHFEL